MEEISTEYFENNTLLEKISKSKLVLNEFKNGKLQYEVLSMANSNCKRTLRKLFEVSDVFQNQLPMMPKNYILSQVMNTKNRALTLIKDGIIIAGILYRPFYQRGFAEIVFLSVDAKEQIKGYGVFIVDLLKEHFKKEIVYFYTENIVINDITGEVKNSEVCKERPIEEYLKGIKKEDLENLSENKFVKRGCLYFMTYDDHYALTFFAKQGFSLRKTSDDWVKYIKDYDGGSLMECIVDWNFNYILKTEEILKEKEKFFKIFCDQNLIKKLDKNFTKNSILGEEDSIEPRQKLTYSTHILNGFEYILSVIMMDPHSWAFLNAVSELEVPGYSAIIKEPMDLGTMMKKVENKEYKNFIEFQKDFKLIAKNCLEFNGANSIYSKNVLIIDKKFLELCTKVEKSLNIRHF